MKIARTLAALALTLTSLTATASDIMVVKPQAFATRDGQPNAAAFVEIHNHGKAADRLTAVKFPSAVVSRGELHSMSHEDGKMVMRELKGVPLPAGGSIKMQPGGDHLMLIGLKRTLKVGEIIDATLVFEKAGEIKVSMPVVDRAAAMKQEGQGHHGHMKH
ncbi:MAG: copper chaperone PCu(A)C [Burkholderiaceae bacterium]